MVRLKLVLSVLKRLSVMRVCELCEKLLPLAALIIVSFLILHPIFNSGFIFFRQSCYPAESYFLCEHLIPEHHWISGQCQYDFAGFPMLLYYSWLGFGIISVLNLFLSFPVEFAYKILILISCSFPACALYLWSVSQNYI